jgi:diguanylate cyclase (GGDEF)-like protein
MLGSWEREDRRRLRRKLRDDFQFAMVVWFGLLAALIISGFAVYRFAFGYYLGGTINAVIVASVLFVTLYAIRGGNTRAAGRLFVVVIVLGCILSTAIFGRTGILWSYVALWVSFLLADRRFSLIANMLLISMVVVDTGLFASALEGVTFIITALMVTMFAYIFADRLTRYRDQLERLALQDPLTYAGNRRMMRSDFNAVMASRRRSGRDFTLVLLDLDHFKAINDRWGHEAGDQVLRDFADLVRGEIRADDRFYRFGGEEFVLLLPDTGPADAMDVARSLHERISGRLVHDGDPVRFSAGVAVLGDNEDWQQWLTRADRAMYRAKHAGRDRVEAAPAATGDGEMSPKTRRLSGDDAGISVEGQPAAARSRPPEAPNGFEDRR